MAEKYSNHCCAEIHKIIEPLLGDMMAKNILKVQAKKIGKTEETINLSDLPNLAEAIKTGLIIFLGSEASKNVAARILKIG